MQQLPLQIPQGIVAAFYRWGGEIYNLMLRSCFRISLTKNY